MWAPVLMEVLSFLEYTRGRILVDGKTNVINIVPNNIYCFRKLLSAIAVSLEKGQRGAHIDSFSFKLNLQNYKRCLQPVSRGLMAAGSHFK